MYVLNEHPYLVGSAKKLSRYARDIVRCNVVIVRVEFTAVGRLLTFQSQVSRAHSHRTTLAPARPLHWIVLLRRLGISVEQPPCFARRSVSRRRESF